MTLPDIMAELRQLAQDYNLPRLKELADEIRRRPGTRGRYTSRKTTEFLREQIRLFRVAHPGLSQKEIADHFGVNPGRVSEALKGFRT